MNEQNLIEKKNRNQGNKRNEANRKKEWEQNT